MSDWTAVASAAISIVGGANDIGAFQKGATSVSKSFGVKLAVVGIAVTSYDIYAQGLNTNRAIDLAMAGVAFVPGVGWAISGSYFVANLLTIGITGQSIGDHIQGAITGEDGTQSWQPWNK